MGGVTLYLRLGLLLAAAAAALYIKHLYDTNVLLRQQVKERDSIIAQQQAHAELMNDVLTERDQKLEEVQATMQEMMSEYENWRKQSTDNCINSDHPDLGKWLSAPASTRGSKPAAK